MCSSKCHKLARSRAWACEIWPREQWLPECFSVMESHFPTEILARPVKIFEIRLLHVVAEHVFFLKVPNLHMNSQWAKKTLCAKVIPREENMCWISSIISLLKSIFPRTVDVAPSVGFRWSPCPCKACDVFFGVSQISREVGHGPVRYDPTNRGCRSVFPWRRVIFQLRLQLDRGRSWKSKELHVVAERVFFLKVSNLRINSQWAKNTLHAKVIPWEERTCWISSRISLLLSIFLRMVDVALSLGFWWYSCA